MSGYSIDFDYFLTELIGEILYNNPVVYVLIILGIIAGFKGKLPIEKSKFRIILFSGLPIVITFLIFSLTRRTLPHWTAPGITSLIPIAALYVATRAKKGSHIPKSIIASLAVLILGIILGFAQIQYGIIPLDNTEEYHRVGKNDPSLDMYGYKQAGEEFENIFRRDVDNRSISENSILIGSKWFPLANFDYYAAYPAGMRSYGLGDLEDIHKYAWINNHQGGFSLGMDAYYLTDSREYNEPDPIYYEHFETISPADTIQIYRGNNIVKRVFVFRMNNMIKIPTDVLKVDK